MAEATGGEIAGCVSLYRGYAGWRGRPVACVHLIFVRDEFRGRGIARRLIAAVSTLVLERDWLRIELFVEEDRPAVTFYETVGMVDR